MDIFKNLQSANDVVFYTRNDPHDVRLGDTVLRNLNDYRTATWVILGCPSDDGVVRNKGRAGSKLAPHEIRKHLYRYPLSKSHEDLSLLDLGDVIKQDNLESTHEVLHEVVKRLICDRKNVIVLGGSNDISYPDCSALAAGVDSLLVFNVDRHLDVRDDSQRNSGTPYRQLLDEELIDPCQFHEFGINSFSNSQTYLKYIEEIGAHIHYLGDIRGRTHTAIQAIMADSQAEAIFLGFDLDVVRAVEAPGVSDPCPMGLTAVEVCEIADAAASESRVRMIEITEVNPTYDVDGITCKLAANILVRALANRPD